ncbi:RICIN domain-containing protein [Actinoplanes sp. NPDC049596]|uniref:RICIN domain-containing protein n=1 Tax=unclassified Actinoplanes TaxID=2626549 RepID=UPI0034255FA1
MYLSSAYNDYYCVDYNSSANVPVLGECDYSYEWLFVPVNSSQNTYKLTLYVGQTNMCLEQPSRSSDHLIVSWCDGAQNQTWKIAYRGPGNVLISYAGTGACLDAPFGGSAVIAARACHYGTNQQWYNF